MIVLVEILCERHNITSAVLDIILNKNELRKNLEIDSLKYIFGLVVVHQPKREV